MPVPIISTNEVHFYFAGDPVEVKKLIDKHLVGIGKKVKIGLGWYKDFQIIEVKDAPLLYYRPISKSYEHLIKQTGLPYDYRKIRITPPYWVRMGAVDACFPVLPY